jgi:Ca-activated chloride channel family protein
MSPDLRSRYGLGPSAPVQPAGPPGVSPQLARTPQPPTSLTRQAATPRSDPRQAQPSSDTSRTAEADLLKVPPEARRAEGRSTVTLARSATSGELPAQVAPVVAPQQQERRLFSPELMKRYGLVPAPEREQDDFMSPRQDSNDTNPGYTGVGRNTFQTALHEPLSTFGLDVDTGSYANVRRFLRSGRLPPPEAVRIEEMLNYFPYDDPVPAGRETFAIQMHVASCPWEPRHRLVRIAIKARDLNAPRPAGNMVFLVDVSGSMRPAERLPLLKQALRALVRRLAPTDRVAIVTYATTAGVHLPSTSCEDKERILAAIDALDAGGSTHGEGGIHQAYDVASRHFNAGGINRVLLCTDGDFNVGIHDQSELVRLIREKARSGVFLTTLGVGTDNFKDALMRQLADHGNGNYHYLDSFEEAQRVLLEQMNATLVTVARDAKAQVEFNPANVAAWRLVGYEKRLIAHEDFNDDTRDGGEIGAGHTVTVLYEIVPAGQQPSDSVGPLKYQRTIEPQLPARELVSSPELLTLKLRYQRPEGSRSELLELPLIDAGDDYRRASPDFKFAAAVAAFGMSLRGASPGAEQGLDLALRLAREGIGDDSGGWRAEFITLVEQARRLSLPRLVPARRWEDGRRPPELHPVDGFQ